METSASQFEELLERAMATASGAPQGPLLHPSEDPLLNGLPYRSYRSSVSLHERRTAGTFFSGPKLARLVADRLRAEAGDDALVMDPTCGIGDLLLAYAELLPLRNNLLETIELWGDQLAGADLRSELVRMTKVRLVTLARARGGFREDLVDLRGSFPNIVVGDMLQQSELLDKADAFLFNPPFGMTSGIGSGGWATGLVNSAALFLSTLVERRKAGAPIVAVLPEVLRCGSRYAAFRRHLEESGVGGSYESFGRFDPWTDVDVFVSTLRSDSNPQVWRSNPTTNKVISDLFDIRIGPVVPHRHQNVGKWHPYICAKSTPRWSTSFAPKMKRRFSGAVVKPPFVVVRRTSSPSDKERAVGSIIVSERSVAVENHLVVLKPKSGGIDDCKRLLYLLKSTETTDFLNREMRCRHLTKGAIASIPWKCAYE